MSYYCDRCDEWFNNWYALQRHENRSDAHNVCRQCDEDFPTWMGLKEHWVQSSVHAYCQYCSEHFDDHEELRDHYESKHSYCRQCNRVFVNQLGLNEHYRQSPRHYYCPPCNRLFQNQNNLDAHLNSSVHRPKDVKCPFKCGNSFVSRSALVLHPEGGSCSSGVDRKTVNRYVRQLDTSNVITDPSRLLTSGLSGNEEVTYIASRASWNGHGYECYLCNKVHRSLHALNQHLASPRHQDKVYICRGPSCSVRFSTLSALVQHIESERCDVMKFKSVQATMDRLLGQMPRLTYR